MSLLRADLFKTRKRPMGWIMLLIGIVIVSLFMVLAVNFAPPEAALFLDFSYPAGLGTGPGAVADLGTLMMVVFGASLAGLEYRFDTWKNVLTRRAGRIPFIISKWLTLLIAVVLSITALALWGQGLGLILQRASGTSAVNLGSVLASNSMVGLSWLAGGTIGLLGAILGRTTVAGIIMGVVWTIIDPLIDTVVQFSDQLAWIRNGLFSTAFTSLTASVEGLPGQLSVLHSSVVVAAYVIVPLAVAALVFRQRDMAG